jgi:hypothetical protein
MLVQPASDPPVLGRERDEAGEERSLRSWAGFTEILPSGGVFTAVGGWVPSGAPSPSVGMRLAWWSCARRRASLGECVYDRADSVPPREGRQVGEDGAQRCVEDRVQRKGALRGDNLKPLLRRLAFGSAKAKGRERLRADASGTDRLGGSRAARWFRGQKRRTVERLGWRHRPSGRCLLLSSTTVRPDPGCASKLRLRNRTWEWSQVENPIGAGAARTFGSESETDPQAVTLCGARSALAAEARERKSREVGSATAGGRASEGRTPRGPRSRWRLRFGAVGSDSHCAEGSTLRS